MADLRWWSITTTPGASSWCLAVRHVIVGLVETGSRLPAHSVIDYSNRTVFVTGGSRGVGRAAAALRGGGADVAIRYHTRRCSGGGGRQDPCSAAAPSWSAVIMP
jgi:hypothetical protein